MKSSKMLGEGLDFSAREAYNLLRANILLSFTDEENCKIIGITSASPQEGKSLTSINFAYSLAKGGKKVLIIDSDMRRPTLTRYVDFPASPGLSNLLTGTKENCIHIDGDETNKFSIILSGDVPPNPSELISSEKMKKLITTLAKNYDFIILDLPPVNAVSDVLSVSNFVDGFVFVVKHEQTHKKEINEAIRQLNLAKARIIGFVYNGFYRRGTYYKKRYYKGYKNYRYSKYYKYYKDYYKKPEEIEAKNEDAKEEPNN